jgi:glucans biosynthesis protein
MQPTRLEQAPRCGAKTRNGSPCRSPAVHGRKRCRMHGGTNPGAPKGNRNAWKHGLYSREMRELRRLLRELETL